MLLLKHAESTWCWPCLGRAQEPLRSRTLGKLTPLPAAVSGGSSSTTPQGGVRNTPPPTPTPTPLSPWLGFELPWLCMLSQPLSLVCDFPVVARQFPVFYVVFAQLFISFSSQNFMSKNPILCYWLYNIKDQVCPYNIFPNKIFFSSAVINTTVCMLCSLPTESHLSPERSCFCFQDNVFLDSPGWPQAQEQPVSASWMCGYRHASPSW